MGNKIKLDPKTMKKIEADAQRRIDAAQRKYPIPADASPAERDWILKKIAKEASK